VQRGRPHAKVWGGREKVCAMRGRCSRATVQRPPATPQEKAEQGGGTEQVGSFIRGDGVERQGETNGVRFQEAPARMQENKTRCRNSPKCPNAGPKGVSEECKQVGEQRPRWGGSMQVHVSVCVAEWG